MSNYTLLRAKGLSIFSNPLSQAVSEGSFADVSNVVIDRNEIIEPRRGIAQYGTPFGTDTDLVKQLINYKDVVIRHVLERLEFDFGNGYFIPFTSPDDINATRQDLRIKSIEANGNLYFTTSAGIKKISAVNSSNFPDISITDAGGVNALDLMTKPDYTTPGFLPPNSKVGYSVVWAQKDLNENLILGKPSSRSVVYNRSATDTCVVELEFPVPSEVTSTDYFYQIYRTAVFSADLPTDEPPDPGFDMNLVFEEQVTSAQLLAGIVITSDITPEDFRASGTILYTSPVSGDGIAQANDKPPFATDIALYKQYTFYANTRTVHRFYLSFISANIDQDSTITINSESGSEVYTFKGAPEEYTLDFTGMSHTDFNGDPLTTYFTITSANDETTYLVYYTDDPLAPAPTLSGALNIMVDVTGAGNLNDVIVKTIDAIYDACDDFNISRAGDELLLQCSNNGYVTVVPTVVMPSPFALAKLDTGIGEDAALNQILLPRIPTGEELGPTPGQQLEQMARSFVRVVTKMNPDVYGIYLSGYEEVPGQILLESRRTVSPSFSLNSDFGRFLTPEIPETGSTANSVSTNEVRPNRVYYSKYQQPEAVPLVNYIDIGPKDREIKRIIALRDSLFVLKEDGIYRISGESAPFIVTEFDFSTQVLAPDTAVVLNNQIYALSTLGVIVITEGGVEVVSRQIENALLQVMKIPNYKALSFGLSYESDKSYLLFLPTRSSDTVATTCYRFNVFTNAWTKWDVSHTCGIVDFGTDTMFLGAGDINRVEKERKSLSRMDHADREYTIQILNNGVDGFFIKVNDISKFEPNDVIIQKQYLTTSQYNRMLLKLDNDIGVSDNDYITLEAFAGDDMRQKLVALANKMDLDPGIAVNTFAASIPNVTTNVTDMVRLVSGTRFYVDSNAGLVPDRILAGNNSEIYTIVDVDSDIDGDYVDVAEYALTMPTIIQTAVNNFKDMQVCFNIMVNLLNNDSQAFYSNYPLSTDSINLETPVIAINKQLSTVELKYDMDFILGDITLYKSIKTMVQWNPVYFGDPAFLKQVREGTMIFENSNFSSVKISYATDLGPSFKAIEFSGDGLSVGDWGYFNWGTINWGGVAAPIPLRTYIPAEKQRCRFINIKFEHSVAFEKYAVYGLSLVYRVTGTRAYR